MAMRAQALARALPVIAGYITDRTNVPIMRGERAKTDGNVIVLPQLPELDLEEKDLVKAVGYIYHECGHIKHSDFSLSASTALEQAVTGILEDVRIEALMMRSFPAARRYLCRLVEIMVENGLSGEYPCFPVASDKDTEQTTLQRYMLYRLRRDLLNQQALDPLIPGVMSVAAGKFTRGMLTRLDALMYEVASCETEADVFALAAEIIKMIEEEKEKEKEKEEQSRKENGQDGPQGQSGPGQPGASQPQGGGEQGQTGEQNQDPSSMTGGSGAGGKSAGLEQLLQMEAGDIEKPIGEMLAEALNQVAAKAKWDRQSISMPNVYPLSLARAATDMAALRASINAVRTKTLAWMSSASETDCQHARTGMMLDPAMLYAAPLGGDVFVREAEGIDRNAAVSILIDRSGSMSGTIGDAVKAALAAILAYDVQGITTQVAVFPVSGGHDEGLAVIKRWNESPRDLAGRISSLRAGGGTPMSEAMLWAVADLVRRQETLRLVMVVTDGMPNNLESARAMVAKARTEGVSMVGLGIGVDPSSVFGETHSATLTRIDELSGAMVRLIKASMLDNKR